MVKALGPRKVPLVVTERRSLSSSSEGFEVGDIVRNTPIESFDLLEGAEGNSNELEGASFNVPDKNRITTLAKYRK